jgi:DNA-binding transcriptional LysR family regulator
MFLHDIRQLQAFRSLVQTHSFTETARELYVTQAAISYSIKNLEISLGCKLFVRSGRDIFLTAEGKIFLPHCTVVLQRLTLAEEEIANIKNWGNSVLKLGASEAACEYLLQTLLGKFRESFPDVVIDLIPASTDELLVMLDSGEIDLAIGVNITSHKKSPYLFYKLFEDEKTFIVSPRHPWAKKDTLTDADIAKESIITATRHRHTKQLIEAYFESLGIPMTRAIEVFNVDIQKKMVAMDLGVGIASPWMLIDELSAGNLITIPIPQKPIIRFWGVMANRDHALSMVQQSFIRMLEESVRILSLSSRSLPKPSLRCDKKD